METALKKYMVKLTAYKIGHNKPIWKEYATMYAEDREDAKDKITAGINADFPYDTTVKADMRTVKLARETR